VGVFRCNFTEFPRSARRLAGVGARKRATVGERAGKMGNFSRKCGRQVLTIDNGLSVATGCCCNGTGVSCV
jgi:hypothetical protein